jgi:hypothetical protein
MNDRGRQVIAAAGARDKALPLGHPPDCRPFSILDRAHSEQQWLNAWNT